MSGPLVLGIESSCDETSVGIVRGAELLANEVASSVAAHARFGGVVPEVASRAHLEAMTPTLERALSSAGIELAEVDAIAVTAGPGLMGSLVVGLAAAKALASALGKPLYGLNHLVGHVAVDILDHGPLPEPVLALLVSGGHSQLLLVRDITGDITEVGTTIDDAAGEAYDKVARLLGLAYPGGPEIDRLAQQGNCGHRFPPRSHGPARPGAAPFRLPFRPKTAVARYVEQRERDGEPISVPDVSASFQEAVADVLTAKAVDAARHFGVDHLVLGGGVAANSRLRTLMAERAAAAGIELRRPRPGLCTDNGAMIAVLGAQVMEAGRPPSSPTISADSGMPVERVLA